MRSSISWLFFSSSFLCSWLFSFEAPPEETTKQPTRSEEKHEQQGPPKIPQRQGDGQQAGNIPEQQQTGSEQQQKQAEGTGSSAVPVLGGQPESGNQKPTTKVEHKGTEPQITQKPGPIEQQVIKAQDATAWQKAWQTFAKNPGVWGKGGELFTNVLEAQRAQKIIDIIQQIPHSVLKQRVEGKDSLPSVLKA